VQRATLTLREGTNRTFVPLGQFAVNAPSPRVDGVQRSRPLLRRAPSEIA
jgi:hypothetical protein